MHSESQCPVFAVQCPVFVPQCPVFANELVYIDSLIIQANNRLPHGTKNATDSYIYEVFPATF